jgi:hypothetical protein
MFTDRWPGSKQLELGRGEQEQAGLGASPWQGPPPIGTDVAADTSDDADTTSSAQ